jgi:chromosome segregation ATPase
MSVDVHSASSSPFQIRRNEVDVESIQQELMSTRLQHKTTLKEQRSEFDKTTQQLQEEIADMENKMAELESRHSALEKHKDSLLAKVERSESAAQNATARFQKVSDDLQRVSAEYELMMQELNSKLQVSEGRLCNLRGENAGLKALIVSKDEELSLWKELSQSMQAQMQGLRAEISELQYQACYKENLMQDLVIDQNVYRRALGANVSVYDASNEAGMLSQLLNDRPSILNNSLSKTSCVEHIEDTYSNALERMKRRLTQSQEDEAILIQSPKRLRRVTNEFIGPSMTETLFRGRPSYDGPAATRLVFTNDLRISSGSSLSSDSGTGSVNRLQRRLLVLVDSPEAPWMRPTA